MKKKTKAAIIAFTCVMLIAATAYLIIGNPFVFINNQKLESSIKAIGGQTVKLNEIIPFEWDRVYTFGPYQSKESIEDIIGFESADIKANNINEGMVHLLFVKDKKVVSSILAYSQNLGYSINFASEVSFEDNAEFNVDKMNGVTKLTCAK